MKPAKSQTNPLKFLLNKAEDQTELDKQAVEAPAFSLTKVLGTAALIVAPIATVLVEAFGTIELDAPHYVALAIGLLGFLAITSAADVLARSVVTAAEMKAEAELDARSDFIRFQEPLPAHELIDDQGGHRDVLVLGIRARRKPRYMVANGEGTTWKRPSEITIPRPPE
jgi:hypothetical protein